MLIFFCAQCAELSKTFSYDDGKVDLDFIRLILVIYKMGIGIGMFILSLRISEVPTILSSMLGKAMHSCV